MSPEHTLVAATKYSVAFEAMMQTRNKVVATYNEVIFQYTPKHSLSEIWKRLPRAQHAFYHPKGRGFKPELVLDEHAGVKAVGESDRHWLVRNTVGTSHSAVRHRPRTAALHREADVEEASKRSSTQDFNVQDGDVVGTKPIAGDLFFYCHIGMPTATRVARSAMCTPKVSAS